MSLPVFVINLPEHRARRTFMLLQTKALGLEATIWSAIDGRRLSERECAAHYSDTRARAHRRSLSSGEVGCALSHISIYRHMIEKNIPYAMILEDDAVLGKFTRTVIDRLEPLLKTDSPMVVLLTHLSRFCMRASKKITNHHRLVRVWKAGHGYGYLINRSAAECLSKELYPVFTTADNWTRVRRESRHIQLLGIHPYCIGQSVLDAVSSLEPDRSPKRTPRGGRRVGHAASIANKLFYQLLLKPWYRIKKQTSTW